MEKLEGGLNEMIVKRVGPMLICMILFSHFFTTSGFAETHNRYRASEFTLLTSSDQKVKLSDYKGEVVVLSFWTTWCGYCQEELTELSDFNEQDIEGVEIVAVNVTSSESSVEEVRQFSQQAKLTFTVGLDIDGKVAKDYRLMGVPTTFIIDENGMVAHKVMGPITSEQLTKLIEDI
ncbi:TlpA family protein disulfide reductase [Bacillus weihaiensis]|uniref:TlpA family protein disulfide reductase n=1 Tax=Bacillus weihaiensis TaxID=1547283 RepID=UPI002355AE41|nr:TlpA disulfide reductase family protein [Bacillus weihaiensis]